MVPHSRATVRFDRLRALNVPIPVTVTLDDMGMPVEVKPPTSACTTNDAASADSQWSDTTSAPSGVPSVRQSGGSPPSCGRIAEVLEVWRIDDEWWRAPITRRYVDVVLEGGAHVVLFEDLQTAEWFVQQP